MLAKYAIYVECERYITFYLKTATRIAATGESKTTMRAPGKERLVFAHHPLPYRYKPITDILIPQKWRLCSLLCRLLFYRPPSLFRVCSHSIYSIPVFLEISCLPLTVWRNRQLSGRAFLTPESRIAPLGAVPLQFGEGDSPTAAIALEFSERRPRVRIAVEVAKRHMRCGHSLPRIGGRRDCAGRAGAHQQQQSSGDERGEGLLASASSCVLHADCSSCSDAPCYTPVCILPSWFLSVNY